MQSAQRQGWPMLKAHAGAQPSPSQSSDADTPDLVKLRQAVAVAAKSAEQ
jgi:hypothetical protein